MSKASFSYVIYAHIGFGWPAVLSGLKTIIESPHIFGVE